MVAFISATHGADDCGDRAGTQPNRCAARPLRQSRARDGGVTAVLSRAQGGGVENVDGPADHRRSRCIRVSGLALLLHWERVTKGWRSSTCISSIGTSVVPY